MAENINISFAPNKAASESQRIADLEQYVSTLTERTKFAFASIIEEYNDTADDKQTLNMIYQAVSESGSDVGQFTSEYFSEIFNDYENNVATAPYSHAEGYQTTASAPYCHSEGSDTIASAPSCHTEGAETKATNNCCHAEGYNTEASGGYSHAEGRNTKATGWTAHAEGESTVADGMYSHAEGSGSKAIGGNSHAGGMNSEAIGTYSFTHGYGTKTSCTCGTALGISNKTQNALFVIGNGGWREGGESDALTLSSNGELWVSGSIKSDGTSSSGMKGIAVKGSARFGEHWTTDSTSVLLAVGNGYDNERLSDALTLDNEGNLTISGKFSSANGYDFSNAIASSTALGAIKIGDNLSISEDGTLSANVGEYTLPVATADTLGGVKIGDNITVTDDGTISVDLSSYLKSADISDWAKAEEKPSYTAGEVGAAAKSHTHTKSEITDFPTLGTAAGKNADYFATAEHTHTAGEIGAAEKKHSHSVSDITDMPTKLPANGGNADTVDGKHASDFATARHTHTATEVGATTAADITAAVNAVEIGGRNLLYHSRFDKKYPNAWAYSETVSYTFDGNAATLTKSETTTRQFTTQASVSNGVVAANPNLLPENGCTYTISCEIMKIEGYDVGNGTKITNRYNFADGTVKDFDVDVSGASETAWTKYSRTYTYASDKTVRYTQFIVALGAQACGIRIKNVKFEKGNKATDWSPAPEDDERRIASLEARVAALEAMAVSGGEV